MSSRYRGKSSRRVLDDGGSDPSILITWPEKAVTIGGEHVRIKMVKIYLKLCQRQEKIQIISNKTTSKNVLRFATLPMLVTPVVQRQRLGWEKVCSNFIEPLVQFQHYDRPSYKSAFERQRRNKNELKRSPNCCSSPQWYPLTTHPDPCLQS